MIENTESSVLRTIMHQVNAMSLPVRYRLLLAEFSKRTQYDYHDKITSALRARNFPLARKLTIKHVTSNLSRATDVYQRALYHYGK